MFEKFFERFLGSKKVSTWKTKGGKVLKIKKMTSSHLRNVLIFLSKKARHLSVLDSYLAADTSDMGDAALDCFNMEFDNLLREDFQERSFEKVSNKDCQYLPDVFYVIREELKKRGEDVKEFEYEEEVKGG